MPAPAIWAAPVSGGTASITGTNAVASYVNGYWTTVSTSPGYNGTLRYATEPSGAWSSVDLPSLGSNSRNTPTRGVAYDGTNYWLVSSVSSMSPNVTSNLDYATSLGGTWNTYDLTGSTTYLYRDNLQAGTAYVGIGETQYGSGSSKELISVGSSLTSVPTATLGTVNGQYGWSIDYSDGTYVKLTAGYGVTGSILQYSTSPTSGYSDSGTSFPISSHGVSSRSKVRYVNGYWVALLVKVSTSRTVIAYASDPASTWTEVDLGWPINSEIIEVAYGSGYWVAVGGVSGTSGAARLAYLAAGVGVSPSGTWTTVNNTALGLPAATERVMAVAHANGTFVIVGGDDYSTIRYSTVVTGAPSLLRQRQSPKRTPSRVRGVDLRQSQTPFIR